MRALILGLLVPMSAFAMNCEVDGISDSPQKMNCYIHEQTMIEKLQLRCHEGNYRIHWKNKAYDVQMAYHEEVEEGSSPLVFTTDELSLTTVSYSIYHRADLSVKGRKLFGLCFNEKGQSW